ncbi:FAD-linked sulfhydryl oxidase ERV2 [Choanephora cucurbitarum]|uniref:Sulfhydryl oxidase n=1 Tax=Choanephora cucurbitarum TaxID=101091 RepID=A0A1C7NVY7_9FUNG|nr:FAD-linked sulfhydryl oxidase ERV2 [Choanephora cucurbitarum]
MIKKQNIIASIGIVCLFALSILFLFYRQTDPTRNNRVEEPITGDNVEADYSKVIMSSMGNQTQRAELGRATWKFLHTMVGRFPEKPSENERKSLHDFMMLFSTLYPCGDCARHFNKLITTYPPQTSSRFAATQWLCAMHNKVNERLNKPIFDCAEIESKYPCGCADETKA